MMNSRTRTSSTLGIIVMLSLLTTIVTTSILLESQYVGALRTDLDENQATSSPRAQAPIATSGDNIYIAWWTNNTANSNEEVMFRASSDGGAFFGDKINLSNTTNADSTRVEIAGEGDTVVISWWETNQTSDIPVARISTDGGETFGPMLMLAANGTIDSTEEGGGAAEGGETTEEEAVGGAEVAE
jgi:hypothetical protein